MINKNTVDRVDFLTILQNVASGLSNKNNIEQASCFIFKNGWVITMNGEISCRMKCPLKNLKGAVPAMPLLQILSKMNDEQVSINQTESHLEIEADKKKLKIKTEGEILSPIEDIENPKTWVELDSDFNEAIKVVYDCASTNQQESILTFVNFTPNFIEANDRFRIMRYFTKIPIEKNILIRRDSVKKISTIQAIKMSVCDSWVHFKTELGLFFSVRKFEDAYPDVSKYLTVPMDAVNIQFPLGLADAVQRSEVFASDNTDDSLKVVSVELFLDRIKISGSGVYGEYFELNKAKYTGKPFRFCLSPNLLQEVIKKGVACQISKDQGVLIAKNSSKWVFANALELRDPSMSVDAGNLIDQDMQENKYEEQDEESQTDNIPF